MAKRNNKNVFLLLTKREYKSFTHLKCHKIIRSLILGTDRFVCFLSSESKACHLKGEYFYKKEWEISQNRPIFCSGKRVFFGNYKYWYNGSKKMSGALPSFVGKVEDALVIGSSQLNKLPGDFDCYKGRLLCLHDKHWLSCFDIESGRCLQRIFLSPCFTFREIAWNEFQNSFFVKTTNLSPIVNIEQQAQSRGPRTPVSVVAVFKTFPLQLEAMMDITKEVFGKDIKCANVSMHLLIAMFQSHVKMYSMQHIYEQSKQFEAPLYEEYGMDGRICGLEPHGIPFNVHILEAPPVLFEVKCHQQSVDIGGHPWHYLFSPPDQPGCFHLHNLATHSLCKNGIVTTESNDIELDRMCFHGDESGRLLHITNSSISMFSILSDSNNQSQLHQDFQKNFENKELQEETPSVIQTLSGRVVKKTLYSDEIRDTPNISIHNVEYEDDLDLLVSSTVTTNASEVKGRVNLHDNWTGQILKSIPIDEPWSEYYEHRVSFDVDSIVQIVKPCQGKFYCAFYSLTADLNPSQATDKKVTKPKQAQHLQVRRTQRR